MSQELKSVFTQGAVPAPGTDSKIKPQATELKGSEKVAYSEAESASVLEVPQKEAVEFTSASLEKVARQLQEFASSLGNSLAFSVDDSSGKHVITVTNKESGEEIRQIPSDEVLKLAANLSKAVGIIIEDKV